MDHSQDLIGSATMPILIESDSCSDSDESESESESEGGEVSESTEPVENCSQETPSSKPNGTNQQTNEKRTKILENSLRHELRSDKYKLHPQSVRLAIKTINQSNSSTETSPCLPTSPITPGFYSGMDDSGPYKKKKRKNRKKRKGAKKYNCTFEDCFRTFATLAKLNSHVENHATFRPFQCHCGFKFRSAPELISHYRRHSVRKNSCPYCDKKFHNEEPYFSHLKTHPEFTQE